MDFALQEQLCTRYPLIFQQRTLPETETAMCRGIATGDGWYALIDVLCSQLQRMTDQDGAPQVVAAQVKDKFGSLRFYTCVADERQKAMIELARERSRRTCDVCGAPGTMVSTRQLTATRCEDHAPR